MFTENLFQVYFEPEGQSGGNGDNSTPETTEEKKFTQADVDKIVSGRLAKEKEKYADYDALKTKVGEFDIIKQQKADLETKTQESDNALNEVLTDLLASVEENKKTLIPEQFNVLEKIKFINKNKSNLFNVSPTNVQTPPPENKNKGQAGLYGGKYQTLLEWANKEPVAYLKWRQENP